MLHLLRFGADAGGAFRLRGKEVSRLECFSDCVFALALTMMVVSTEVPRTWIELKATLPGFFGFAGCFVAFVMLWHRHSVFFRRYGLQDPMTVVLNSALLLVALYFVYPLKFLATTLVAVVVALVTGGDLKVRLPGGGEVKPIGITDLPSLLALYLGGLAMILLLFALMHRHALRRLGSELNADELRITRAGMRESLLGAVVLGLTCIVCLSSGGMGATLAPLCVLLLFPGRRWLRRVERRQAAAK